MARRAALLVLLVLLGATLAPASEVSLYRELLSAATSALAVTARLDTKPSVASS